MDKGTWWTTVYGVADTTEWLTHTHTHTHTHTPPCDMLSSRIFKWADIFSPKWKSLSCVWLSKVNPIDCSRPGSSVHGILQARILEWVFPTQGLKPGVLHRRRILYHLSHQGSPRILERIAYPFSRASSWPQNRPRVSSVAGRVFTSELPWKMQYKNEELY